MFLIISSNVNFHIIAIEEHLGNLLHHCPKEPSNKTIHVLPLHVYCHANQTQFYMKGFPQVLRLGLPSTPIRHENGGFETLDVFVRTGNILKTELFESVYFAIIVRFSCLSFSQTQFQNNQCLLRFQALPRSVNGEHLHSRPQSHDPSDLRQGSRAVALSNTGSPRFTDFPSNLANLIGREDETNTLPVLRKSAPARALDPCAGQNDRGL